MKDYKLSEIKAICKEHESGGDCSQCECYQICDRFTLDYPSEFNIDKPTITLATDEQKAFKDGYKKGFEDGENANKRVIQRLKKIGYCHNFQNEARWVVEYINDISNLLRDIYEEDKQ